MWFIWKKRDWYIQYMLELVCTLATFLLILFDFSYSSFKIFSSLTEFNQIKRTLFESVKEFPDSDPNTSIFKGVANEYEERVFHYLMPLWIFSILALLYQIIYTVFAFGRLIKWYKTVRTAKNERRTQRALAQKRMKMERREAVRREIERVKEIEFMRRVQLEIDNEVQRQTDRTNYPE